MRYLAIAAVFVVAPGLPRAGELESTYFYGFTLGSDVNAVGEIEGEFEAIGRFAKGPRVLFCNRAHNRAEVHTHNEFLR